MCYIGLLHIVLLHTAVLRRYNGYYRRRTAAVAVAVVALEEAVDKEKVTVGMLVAGMTEVEEVEVDMNLECSLVLLERRMRRRPVVLLPSCLRAIRASVPGIAG